MKERKYTYRTPEQWQTHVDKQAQSGLSIKTYCQQHHLTLSNFYSWRKKLVESSVEDSGSSDGWVALAATPMESPVVKFESTASASTEIALALPGGIQLTIRSR